MDKEIVHEKFIDWLTQRMTAAGRGDNDDKHSDAPSGKYWLGRLQSAAAVAASDLGDRGERLEPCAFGIKLRPKGRELWRFRVTTSFLVWKRDGKDKCWYKSKPIVLEIPIEIPAETGAHQIAQEEYEHALKMALGQSGLSARIDIGVELGHSRDLELNISLVNNSPKEHPEFKDTRLYQCELRIDDLETVPFLLESLEDSFRYDRRVDAYGINCGVRRLGTASFMTEDAISVDRKRPYYWSMNGHGPDMRFETLAKDPIPTTMSLLTSLKYWGDENWSIGVLEKRSHEEGWSDEMHQQALRASKDFQEECDRLASGINLLKNNENLLRAFKGMNQAMLFSARGKYDSWRPFQLGFLLTNLRSIIDHDEESKIADVVWFATGGGKTETYLGLLVTAALHDRLEGKISGITAWSRFPLRMLSLQQTQRFADAIAAAEVIRKEMKISGAPFSLGFFVGQGATPNRISPDDKQTDPDDESMPARYQVLEYCPFCHESSIEMRFDRRLWRLNHHCNNSSCLYSGKALPVYVVDEEIYRFLPTIVVGTLDKAASISMQAAMRGFVGAPHGICEKEGHGYTYAPRSTRPTGCLVPGCKSEVKALPIEADRYGPSFRLQDELHLLRDSLGAVDSHYEALYDALQQQLCGRKPKILASSATLTGYEKQIDVLYRRSARVFPVPPPRPSKGFWTSDSTRLMRRFIAIAPRGVTIEYTVDRLLTELQIAIRQLARDPKDTCAEIGVDVSHADELLSLYGTNVVYGNTLRDLEAVMRSMETQVLLPDTGDSMNRLNTASLTGKTDFGEVRNILSKLQTPESLFEERLHIISASSMMSHGVDVDRLNIMVMLGLPLTTAEFIQATARVGRKYGGLVFVIHKIGRERDAGIFRSFQQFVEQGDRFVEPVPVTKRSRRVLEKTIAGLEFARLMMVHESLSAKPLTTVRALKEYIASGRFDISVERDAMIETLELYDGLDGPVKDDLIKWFDELQKNIEIPPNDAQRPTDLSPTGHPMTSLRDVEKQVPISGTRV